MEHCTPINHCLACGGHNLELALDLTDQALANNYLSNANDSELEFPLAVNLCRDCFHLQLTHAVDPEIIYKNYLYVSGTSKTMHDHCDWFARFVKEICPSAKSVLDIGCNDGTQLDYFGKLGFKTYGIDPAENLFAASSQRHEIFCDFFDTKMADRMIKEDISPDVYVAQNSFAHNPDPYKYLVDIKRTMKSSGVFFVQTSQANMVVNDEFDTIYHEHINFFNINSMNQLCKRAGMHLVDVVKTPIHGTSYIFIISPTKGNPARIENLIALESQQGLTSIDRYRSWSQVVKSNVEELCKTIDQGRREGYKIVGYGAAAKGNTLLNFGKIELDVIIDDNPLKQNLYTPGMNIPIQNISYLDNVEQQKVMFVPLAWNFYNEIKQRIQSKRHVDSDIFVRYFPKVRVEQ